MLLLKEMNDKSILKNFYKILFQTISIGLILFGLNTNSEIYAQESLYQIFFDDELIGVVKNEVDAYAAYLRLENEIEESEGRSIQIQNKFDTKSFTDFDSDPHIMDIDNLVDILNSKVDYLVEAYELTIDGVVIGIVNNEFEAQTIITQVANNYINVLSDDPDVQIITEAAVSHVNANRVPLVVGSSGILALNATVDHFSLVNTKQDNENSILLTDESIKSLSEDIDIYSDKPVEIVAESLEITQDIGGRIIYTSKESINSDEVRKNLLTPPSQNISYTFVPGDNLWSVALAYGTTMEHLIDLNPQIDDVNTMQPGDTVLISKTHSEAALSTQLIEKATFIEKIPAEIEYIANSSMYKGEEKIIQRGKDGIKEIYVEIIKVNGQEVGRSVIDEKILYNEEKSIIEYGTKVASSTQKYVEADSSVSSSSKNMFMHPLNGAGWMSSAYGPRWGTFHGGIDFAAVAGTNIYAAASGTVTYSAYNYGGYGYLVIIDHGNGYETYYAHNSKNYAKVGDKVEKGQHIAEVGSTGDSTGNHIHFEIRKNGVRQDPANYISY
ncbi:MAG: hypothetical protein ATN31_03335 [Candidatus Epulonipiscioides saccharophilum]|nr:MAG: hypothetical protein ATN31_03335 [Epulopiscium sp. AS2M-Bin001]